MVPPFVPNNNSACKRDHSGYAILRNNIKFIDSIDGAVATADLYLLAATITVLPGVLIQSDVI